MQATTSLAPSWGLQEIPFNHIEHEKVRDQDNLLYLVAGASFIEIASDLYARNLADYFQGDDEVVQWLNNHWQHEELRHGYALRDYVLAVWPEFDWQKAFEGFFEEYGRLCTVDEFEPTQGLEMVARCVVETGTATFYTALAELAPEPVLRGVANHIRADEVGHYKYFYRFFKRYKQTEQLGAWRIIRALKRRIVEARQSDADIALWHVYVHHAAQPDRQAFERLCKTLAVQVKRHYPVQMAVKMVLRPLALPTAINRFIEGPLARVASWWMLR